MADGQNPSGSDVTRSDSAAATEKAAAGRTGAGTENFRLDSENAAARDEAVERARDYGSLDRLHGESDPANPNIHTGTQQILDPGTYGGRIGAPDDTGSVGRSQTGSGDNTYA